MRIQLQMAAKRLPVIFVTHTHRQMAILVFGAAGRLPGCRNCHCDVRKMPAIRVIVYSARRYFFVGGDLI